MSRRLRVVENPERFVVGAVGPQGDRTFFAQVRTGAETVSVELDEMQVTLLASRIGDLLDEVRGRFGEIPPPTPSQPSDLDPLDMPLDSDFRVGTIGLGWDRESRRVVVEFLALSSDDVTPDQVLSDTEEGPDSLRVFVEAHEAVDFAVRSDRVALDGRHRCPLCGEPMTPGAPHLCLRLNGYRRSLDADGLAALVDLDG